MTRWSDASGFFLLETMGLAMVLVLLASALLLFRQGVLIEEQTRFEAAATCLAESELAHLEYRAVSGKLAEGVSERREYVVFSPAVDESGSNGKRGGDFLIRTTIQRMEQEGTYLAAVTVVWQARSGRQQEQSYQRRLGTYEAGP